MAPVPEERTLLTEIAELKRRLRELEGRTQENVTISKGGLTVSGTGGVRVLDAEGDQTFFVGGLESQWTRPDGQPQSATVISDDNDNWRIAVWDPNPLSGGYQQEVRIWDALGLDAFVTDPAGGIAKPWTPIPMYSRYVPPAGPALTYTHIPVAQLATVQNVWEGSIDQVVSPRIQITGTWGAAVGTNTSTYTLQVNSVTVGTWTATAIESTARGPYDISQLLGYQGVPVRLLVSSTGSGNAACQVNACVQRGS